MGEQGTMCHHIWVMWIQKFYDGQINKFTGLSGIFNKVGALNPGTYEASYYQSQNNKFLGIKTIFVDPDTDPYSWIVTDNLMGFNAMIMNRSDT